MIFIEFYPEIVFVFLSWFVFWCGQAQHFVGTKLMCGVCRWFSSLSLDFKLEELVIVDGTRGARMGTSRGVGLAVSPGFSKIKFRLFCAVNGLKETCCWKVTCESSPLFPLLIIYVCVFFRTCSNLFLF